MSYKDCPECGMQTIPVGCRVCSTCETADRLVKQFEDEASSLRAQLEAVTRERDEAHSRAERLATDWGLKEIERHNAAKERDAALERERRLREALSIAESWLELLPDYAGNQARKMIDAALAQGEGKE